MKTFFSCLILLSFIQVSLAQDQSDIFGACRQGDLQKVKAIAAQNPESLQSKGANGYTPLILAIYNDQEEVAKFLLSKGVDADAQDDSGNTALMGAVFKGHQNQIALLIKHGANINLSNSEKATALTFACNFATTSIVKMLLDAGADPTLKDTKGLSPLDHAKAKGNQEIVDLINNYK